jgi:glycine/D-amino acid oxidase-like deaminating enzyme
MKGHSIIYATGEAIPAEALFLEYAEAGGAMLTPEVFPRSDGTTYVCAISSESPVPADPQDVTPDAGAIERLKVLAERVSPEFSASRIVAEQACYRPVTMDGLPLIGAIPGIVGAYVATGHSVWGILNAPATGEAMAELLAGGVARPVDLRAFEPGRLRALEPVRAAHRQP